MSDMTETRRKQKSPREAALERPKSAKLAIAAYCYHNCHKEESTNSHKVKLLIKTCTRESCLLWPHRGWQKMTGGTCQKRPQQIAPDTQE